MRAIVEPSREVPVLTEADVCVVGGGPGGLPAALAAARSGARTVLVEMQGFLGGMATAGLIGPILGHKALPDGPAVVGGLVRELVDRMSAIGEAWTWERGLSFWGVPFNSEGLKIVADRMVREAGVELLLHSFCAGAIAECGRLTHIILESKSGRQAVAASVFVDATGDADVAFRAGAACTKGRPADGRPMAMGSIFRIGGLDTVSEAVRERALQATRDAIAASALGLYHADLGGMGSTIREDEATLNATRVAGDPTDVRDLTAAECLTREAAWQTLGLWRGVPGAEGLYIVETPAHVGVRESRQVVGEYMLTGADVVAGRKHPDGIARCPYWIDIHCPLGLVERGTVHLCWSGCPKRDCFMHTDFAEQLAQELYPPAGDWFDIPYRSLVPRELDGLLISGRCISADYQAMSAARVMATCMAVGEAAGTAAAMAASAGIQPRAVDVRDLRARLVGGGALV